MPDLKDNRITLFKGLFQQTLAPFLEHHPIPSQLVVNIDADLYSSTLLVLTRCNDILRPGTVIVFDEFSSILHEFRALDDYCSAYMRSYEVLGAIMSPSSYFQIAIRML